MTAAVGANGADDHLIPPLKRIALRTFGMNVRQTIEQDDAARGCGSIALR